MAKEYRQDGLSSRLWRDMSALLDQLERYADATAEAYYLVTSCTNIATIIMDRSPGEALTLARRALLWAPANAHAWSVRATALAWLEEQGIVCAGRYGAWNYSSMEDALLMGRDAAARAIAIADG